MNYYIYMGSYNNIY